MPSSTLPSRDHLTPVKKAASVVVLREAPQTGALPEIFMVRRASSSAFMPDSWVFPGGRVDQQDESHGNEDSSYESAARRECYEEANLDLSEFSLHWFDTWKTPSGESPRRFLARFFTAQIDRKTSDAAKSDGHETNSGTWASAEQFLQLWKQGQTDLPPPTLCILLHLGQLEWHQLIRRPDTTLREPVLPKAVEFDGQSTIVMPHDPEYFELSGDTGSVPQRSHDLPRRFVRKNNLWRPNT